MRSAVLAAVLALASPALGQPAMAVGGVIRDAGVPYTFSRETQGKVVFVDGTWWGVFGGTTGLDFYRFDAGTGTWSKASFPGSHVTSDTNARADVHWDGANLEVLYSTGASGGTGALNLAAYGYTRPNFALLAGFPVVVVSGGAVDKNWSITEDTTGRLWLSFQTTSQYGVVCTAGTGPGGWGSFHAPIFMGNASTGIDGDLGSHGIVSFGGKVGLMWTECFAVPNNHTKFRWRPDASTDFGLGAWSPEELCQEDATNPLLTDDHVCVRSFEGQVWAASKTFYGSSDAGKPRFTLMHRDASGNWTHFTIKTIDPVPDYSTRPIVAIDATNRKAYCIWHNRGIEFDVTSLDSPGTFSSIQTMIVESGTDCCWDSDVAQAPCDATSGLMVIADRNCDGWTLFRRLSLGTPAVGPLATIAVTPNPASTTTGGTVQLTATGKDANGNTVSFTPTWSATGGTITQSGLYTAGSQTGSFAVTASSGSVSGSATVNVGSQPATPPPSPPPQQILTSIAVSPNPASTTPGGTVAFTAQAHDQNGNPMTATFTWATSGGTIDQSGHYTAPGTTGTFDVSASSQGVTGHATVNVSAALATVIVDDSDPRWSVVSGTWNVHFNPLRFGPIDHVIADGTTGVCQWHPSIPSGTYDVYVWVPSRGSAALAVYTVTTASGNVSVTFDQQVQSNWGVFTKIGTWSLNGGTALVRLTANPGQSVAADAVKLVQTGP